MNTKKKEMTELIYYLAVKEDYIDMFYSRWFSAFATWVTDHRVNIYTLK